MMFFCCFVLFYPSRAGHFWKSITESHGDNKHDFFSYKRGVHPTFLQPSICEFTPEITIIFSS